MFSWGSCLVTTNLPIECPPTFTTFAYSAAFCVMKDFGVVVVYTGAFLVYSVMEVLGLMPQEVKSAGLTLPALFSRYYGDLELNFVIYQVKRTAITTLIHAALPTLYCCGYTALTGNSPLDGWNSVGTLLWTTSIAVLLCGLALVVYWNLHNWSNHPLIVQLKKRELPWRTVALSVNMEFRDINKFVSELGGSTLVVTNSWILHCNPRTVYIIHQREAVLNVAAADEHRLSMDGQSKQYININVISLNKKFPSFDVRLNSLQYSNLCDRLISPIRTARDVVIHQSLGDRFAAAFKEQVERNGVYRLPREGPRLEPCVGCLQMLPEVKLQKQCSDDREGEGCRQCFCRPMWCMTCMSKWFAAKQDEYRPEQWMASRAPCPMCRATFCMLDVLKISS